MMIRIKRVYDPPEPTDGNRILVDRLWPRGLSRAGARVDVWAKQVAPSTELRQWYGHDAAKWPQFQARYLAELRENPQAVERLLQEIGEEPVTLLFASRDRQRNNAVVLKTYLEDIMRRRGFR